MGNRTTFPFVLILIIAFINYVGIGVVFPVFSTLLFSPDSAFLPIHTTPEARGFYLGILVALMPIAQFFAAPIWGTLSDAKGRKQLILISLILSFVGYLIGTVGLWHKDLLLLSFSRILIGVGSGNFSVLQASIADITTDSEKPNRYSLFSMAMGSGFACGPFLGGLAVDHLHEIPFIITAFLILSVAALAFFFLKETLLYRKQSKVQWLAGFLQIQKACKLKGLRTIFLCAFLGVFGWCYFFELIPVFLITKFTFSQGDLGLFSGLSGAFYALCTGLLIRPLFKKFAPERLLFLSMIFTGIAILAFGFAPSSFWVWPGIFLIVYLKAPSPPLCNTIVSNRVSSHVQGEALGLLGSVISAAYAIAPFLAGTSVGKYPESAMWIGGGVLLLGGVVGWCLFYRKRFST